MGNEISEPSDIKSIFDKPGRDWTPTKERHRVDAWLYEDPQLKYLLCFALCHLGARATPQDAEDTWGEYYTKRMDGVVDLYDPVKGSRFFGFLKRGFKWFCWDQGEKLRKQNEQVTPIFTEDEGRLIEMQLVDDDPDTDAEEALKRNEFLQVLNKGFMQLTPRQQEVFMLCEVEGRPIKETAEILGITEGNVKVLNHRTRHKLAEWLRKEGYYENR